MQARLFGDFLATATQPVHTHTYAYLSMVIHLDIYTCISLPAYLGTYLGNPGGSYIHICGQPV